MSKCSSNDDDDSNDDDSNDDDDDDDDDSVTVRLQLFIYIVINQTDNCK